MLEDRSPAIVLLMGMLTMDRKVEGRLETCLKTIFLVAEHFDGKVSRVLSITSEITFEIEVPLDTRKGGSDNFISPWLSRDGSLNGRSNPQ